MLLVKFTGNDKNFDGELDSFEGKFKRSDFCTNTMVREENFVTVFEAHDGYAKFVAAIDPKKSTIKDSYKAIGEYFPELTFANEEEITLDEFETLLELSERRGYVSKRPRYLMRDLGLLIRPDGMSLFSAPPYVINERIYNAKGVTKKKCISQMNEIMASRSLFDEIDRIFSSSNEKKFMGHPVHYYITAGDKSAADEMLDILIPSLLKNKRLLGGRICDVNKMSYMAYREENFFNIFSSSRGGTVVINLAIDRNGRNYASAQNELLDQIGKMIGEYGNDTLFIFVDISNERNISDEAMAAILGNADMVHICEGYGDRNRAIKYLEKLAEKTAYTDYTIDELIKYLPDNKTEYTVTDVYTAYNKWYGRGLKNHVYRAYADVETAKIEVVKKESTPYEELQNMIGLDSVKQVVDEIISQGKMKKIRERMGLTDLNTSNHMLFFGNPGSAKTTVARLIAEILKNEEILTNGHIVECGRQDLVGKYVGWTAQIVESKFRAARGGILFIDEAYSLVEDHNSFGDEAINTIVQLMENYRDEVIVIFAGYPDKMKAFLDKNEGLRSRIAFHLYFSDYNADELTDILKLMVSKRGFKIEDEAVYRKCHAIFNTACQMEEFGNGRFVRNLLEHAIMRQAHRLVSGSKNMEITKEQTITLTEDDFEMIELKKQNPKKSFGFVS